MRGDFNNGCALVGRHGRAHRRRPYQSPSYFSTQSHTNEIPFAHNPPKRHQPSHTQSSKRNQPPTRNLPKYHSTFIRNPPKRNRRGGACVPARTSAQRRFHAKNTRIVRGELNDGCALAGRHGRAHRHRPYQSLPNRTVCPYPHRIAHSIALNHAVCHYPIGVILSIAQGWQVQRSLPWVTMQARRLPPWGLYFFSSHIITTRANGLFANDFPTRKLILKSTMPMA